jgi:hypothetical protein
MGHLDGGHERDVRIQNISSRTLQTLVVLDQSSEQNPTAALASLHSHIFVREDYPYSEQESARIHPTPSSGQGLRGFHHPAPVQFARAKRAQCRS